MKKIIFVFVGIIAFMLSSCEQDIYNEIYISGAENGTVIDSAKTNYLRLTANIEPQAVTRVLNNQWEAKDAIGVWFRDNVGYTVSNCDNRKFITETGNGLFVPETGTVYFQDSKSHTVTAYYPYSMSKSFMNTPDSSIPFTTITSIATPSGQKKNDFLWAQTTVNWGETANLVFTHQMSKIVLNIIAGSGFTGSEIGGKASEEFVNGEMKIEGLPKGGTFYIQSGGVGNNGAICAVSYTEGTQIPASGVAYCYTLEYLVPSFSLDDLTPKYTFESTDSDLVLSCNLTAINGNYVFDPGYVYTYNILLTKDDLKIQSSSITPWVDGGETTLIPTEE